jgi:uncharacterized membrane protein
VLLGFAPITLALSIGLSVIEPLAIEVAGTLPVHRVFTLLFVPQRSWSRASVARRSERASDVVVWPCACFAPRVPVAGGPVRSRASATIRG